MTTEFNRNKPRDIDLVNFIDRVLFDAEGNAVSDNIGTFVLENLIP